MREIKFRVWNTKTKKWVHGPGDECNLFGEMILMGGFMPKIGIMELNDCVPLQYTGLKDKNKKEIYERDIIKCSAEQMMKNNTPHPNIIYSRDYYGVIEYGAPLFSIKVLTMDGYPPIFWRGIEIIGNIFENPELLK